MKYSSVNEVIAGRVRDLVGKSIYSISIRDGHDVLILMVSGEKLLLEDTADECCECRWLYSDDFKAHRDCEDSEHIGADVMFMHIRTTKGVFVVQAYNAHNGYYAGFDLTISVKQKCSIEQAD